jgi:DNA primase
VGNFFPDQLLERILAETDIVELVSSYFPLKKSGHNWKALCPFHSEKTPSFMVHPERQIFKCFGCGKGGNAFHFLMEKDKVTFQEAVAILAQKASIPLPKKKAVGKGERSKEEMFAAVAFAVTYFQEQLAKPGGEAAVNYLRQRGITDETRDSFRLGFAPKAWDSLYNRATQKFSVSLLEALGLIIPRENSPGFYDRFRNRIMFPIFDPRGRAIGFSGRILPGEEEEDASPKYINSPESPLFNKSQVLYGLNFSRNEIVKQDKAIVCEGHMDLIAIHQAGLRNAVAAQGTSFTVTQARLLKRYCPKVVFAFDSDSAGQEATLRSFETLMQAELDVRVVVLPPGYDPDLLIREKGAEAFRKLTEEAVELVDFQYDVLRKKHDVGTLAGRQAIASQMLVTANQSPSAIVKAAWIQKIAAALAIPEPVLRAEMGRIRGSYRPFGALRAGRDPRGEARENFADSESQRDLVGYMLCYPNVVRLVAERLGAQDFSDPVCRGLVEKILSAHEHGKKVKPDRLLKTAKDTGEAELISRFILKPIESEKPIEAAAGLIERILRPRQVQKKKELQDKIARAEKEGGDRSALLAEFQKLCEANKSLERQRKRY